MNTHRIAGEDLSPLVALALAIIGTLTSVTSAQMLLAKEAAPWATPHATTKRATAGSASAGLRRPGTDTNVERLQPQIASAVRGKRSSGAENGQADLRAAQAQAGAAAPPAPDLDCPPVFNVHFYSGQSSPLGDDLEPSLQALKIWLGRHMDTPLVIVGHTDSSGTEQQNLALSYRRAKAVAALLTAAGVPASRLTVRGVGEYQPRIGVSDLSEHNRWVEIHARGFEQCSAAAEKGGGR